MDSMVASRRPNQPQANLHAGPSQTDIGSRSKLPQNIIYRVRPHVRETSRYTSYCVFPYFLFDHTLLVPRLFSIVLTASFDFWLPVQHFFGYSSFPFFTMQRPTISGPRPSLLHFLLACVFASYFFSLSTALPISVRRRTALAPRAIPNRLSDNPEPFWKAVSPDGRTVPANVRNDVDIFIHEWLNPQAEAGKLRPDDWLSYAGRPDSRNARTVDTLVRPEHMDQNQISGTEAAATLYKEGARGLKKLNKKLAPKVTAVINSIMRLFGGKNKQRIVGTAAESTCWYEYVGLHSMANVCDCSRGA